MSHNTTREAGRVMQGGITEQREWRLWIFTFARTRLGAGLVSYTVTLNLGAVVLSCGVHLP